tara:strand:+ start:684 stop:1463 length:780 start_codon:yes stop_codon:yes gene_type:complete
MAGKCLKTFPYYPFTVELDVFCGKSVKGSPQLIHFLKEPAQIQECKLETMEAGIDYTLACYDHKETVSVQWYNHAGSIQFCGSAAYGLSYYLMRQYGVKYLSILAPHIKVTAHCNSQVRLHIPARTIKFQASDFMNFGALYHYAKSGIYFLEIKEKFMLIDPIWTTEYILSLPLDEPHGLCIFYWEQQKKQGYLRYFTPWHGREEDHVTGSVQQYITPVIHHLYGVSTQHWMQCSSKGGELVSEYENDAVILCGNVRVY